MTDADLARAIEPFKEVCARLVALVEQLMIRVEVLELEVLQQRTEAPGERRVNEP